MLSYVPHFVGLSKHLESLFEVINRLLLLLLGFELLNFFNGGHFVQCGNHFKYADTMSTLFGFNFSCTVEVIESLIFLVLFSSSR